MTTQNSQHILVAEDDSMSRMLLEHQLKGLDGNYKLVLTESGDHALREIEKIGLENICVLILDGNMPPGHDGPGLAEYVRTCESSLGIEPTPIIIQSADHTTYRRHQAPLNLRVFDKLQIKDDIMPYLRGILNPQY